MAIDSPLVTYIIISYLIAGFVKGLTGLGFSTICVGIMASFVDMTLAIPLVIMPSMASCLLVMLRAAGFAEAVTRFLPMYLASFPGLFLGVWLLVSVDDWQAKAALGVVLLVYGAWGLLNPSVRLSKRSELGIKIPVGFFTGVINGLTGAATMPITAYLLSIDLSSREFVQSINIYFVIANVLLFICFGGTGHITLEVFIFSAIGIIPVAIAVEFGVALRGKIAEEKYRAVVLIVLLGLGLNLLTAV